MPTPTENPALEPAASDALIPPAHVERQGHGAAVLLLHGWGCSTRLFDPIVWELAQAFDLVVPDLPGFGETGQPPEAWSVGNYVDWVIALLDSLDLQRVSLIGHSFGGHIGLKLAATHPARIDRLVLTSSAGIREKRTGRYQLKVRTFKALRRLSQARLAPEAVRRLAEREAQKQGSTDYQNATGTLRQSLVRIVNEDQTELLSQIQAPTLLVWGDRDEDTPLENGRLMESLIPDAGLVVFEGAGHFAYLDRAPSFCRIVRTFLQGEAS